MVILTIFGVGLGTLGLAREKVITQRALNWAARGN